MFFNEIFIFLEKAVIYTWNGGQDRHANYWKLTNNQLKIISTQFGLIFAEWFQRRNFNMIFDQIKYA
jgi:hypothetical protein